MMLGSSVLHVLDARDGGPDLLVIDVEIIRPLRQAFADWISQRSSEFRDGIEWAALDPFGGYANALDAATSAGKS
jgi:hypothetical protein